MGWAPLVLSIHTPSSLVFSMVRDPVYPVLSTSTPMPAFQAYDHVRAIASIREKKVVHKMRDARQSYKGSVFVLLSGGEILPVQNHGP